LSIAAVAEQVGSASLPDPAALAPSLRAVLGGVVDPRKRRGVRHGLVVVLTATVCAVAAGARSFVAVAEWVADLPGEVAGVLGVDVRQTYNTALRAVRCRGERGFALLTGRWRALRSIRASPRRIGDYVKAALVLTHIEQVQLRTSCRDHLSA
jgi:hypothetical protein